MELIFTTLALFFITIVASYIFYQRIKLAQGEYEESKDVIRSITFGFTRQLNRMESDVKKIENYVQQAKYMASEALAYKQVENKVSLIELESVKELSDRIEVIEASIDTMKNNFSKLVSQTRLDATLQNPVEAPIPVKGEIILQGLTDTELDVLKMIVDFGEGTVPEIKEHIKKTREHTARLLKKLYDKGFIDRNTSSMPYKYSIRKEIRELIIEKKEVSIAGL